MLRGVEGVINSPIFFPFSDASRHVLFPYLIYSPIRRYEDTPIQVEPRQAMETGRPGLRNTRLLSDKTGCYHNPLGRIVNPDPAESGISPRYWNREVNREDRHGLHHGIPQGIPTRTRDLINRPPLKITGL